MAYYALFFMLCGALFRRMLGTQFYIVKWKVHRFAKLVLLALLCMAMYWAGGSFPKDAVGYLCMAWAIGWTIRYNSHSHQGMFYLYDDTPFRPEYGWIRWILNKIFGHRKYYNFAGKFLGLMVGYLVPALLASITMPHHWFWLAGITTPIGYALCEGALKDKGNSEFAEYFNGSIVFLLFFLNVLI